MNNLVNVKRLL